MKTTVAVEGRDPIIVPTPAHIAADTKRVRALWHDAAAAGVMAALNALHPDPFPHEHRDLDTLTEAVTPASSGVGFTAR